METRIGNRFAYLKKLKVEDPETFWTQYSRAQEFNINVNIDDTLSDKEDLLVLHHHQNLLAILGHLQLSPVI
jgi:hypothetical protein